MTAILATRSQTVATVGSPGARLLAGQPGPETLGDHLTRLGPLPVWESTADAVGIIERSGLAGRGGGYFPMVKKIRTAIASPGVPVVVVNATESEPGSAKDRLLAEFRPHLILDGAQALAAAAGADTIVVATHSGSPASNSLLSAAAERRHDCTPATIVTVPDRYISGESSALVSYLNGGEALPTNRLVSTAVSGVAGRPTVVNNAETVSHLALLARFGDSWFREAGSHPFYGSMLLTVMGDVRRATVVEVVGPARLGDAIEAAGGPSGDPAAVLVGGYAGSWMTASEAWEAPVDPAQVPLGCGLIGVLSCDHCGLAEAAHLLEWLSAQRAGQCGACTLGLPELAERLEAVATGARRGRSEMRRMIAIGQTISGRGLCHLPDGGVTMVETALRVFAGELKLHRRGRCVGQNGYAFPTAREVRA